MECNSSLKQIKIMKTEYRINCTKDGFVYYSLSLSNAFYVEGITERIVRVLERYEKQISYTKRKSHFLSNEGENRVKIVSFYTSKDVSRKVLDYLRKKRGELFEAERLRDLEIKLSGLHKNSPNFLGLINITK